MARAGSLEHSGRTLFDHLLGTRHLLEQWGATSALCDAGLFHSVYGTEHFQPATVPVAMREQVRELIGPEAERLAWLFCVMCRETFDDNLNRQNGFCVKDRLTGELVRLERGEFADLVTLTFANTLEALPRLGWMQRRACRAYLRRFRDVAILPARRAFDETGRPWRVFRM